MAYVDKDTIKAFAEASDASTDAVWEILAASASLIFDRACDLAENFFAEADDEESDKTFTYQKAGYYFLPPYVEEITVTADDEEVDPDDYQIKENFLIYDGTFEEMVISAKWGFAAIPADVQQAVIEQALFMWRRKDTAFTELSGVSTAIVQAQLSPTCEFVAKKYHEKYFQFSV
jgi:hypothetical protein